MDISLLFGGGSSMSTYGDLNTYGDNQTTGAQVVSSTLDLINGSGDSLDLGSITDNKTFGAAVVIKTFDYLNDKKDNGGSSHSLLDLNKNVLGAYYGTKGGITNSVA
jgi:hypothetical protein